MSDWQIDAANLERDAAPHIRKGAYAHWGVILTGHVSGLLFWRSDSRSLGKRSGTYSRFLTASRSARGERSLHLVRFLEP